MSLVIWVIIIVAVAVYLYNKRQKVVNSQDQKINEAHIVATKNKRNEPSLDKTIGEINAVCPYCEKGLKKKPSRKKQCPHCNNCIYKRTRPYDDAHIIIREDQIEDLEEQWAIANGQFDLYLKEKKRRERIKDRLTDQYGNEPTKEDVEFRALNEQATEHELKGNWGFGRNMRLKMAKNLEKRDSYKLALRIYCHVCFLDINGPNNRGSTPNNSLKDFPFFTPENAILAPGVIRLMNDIINKLEYDIADTKQEFIEVTTPIHKGSPTPISPEKAWLSLREELLAT